MVTNTQPLRAAADELHTTLIEHGVLTTTPAILGPLMRLQAAVACAENREVEAIYWSSRAEKLTKLGAPWSASSTSSGRRRPPALSSGAHLFKMHIYPHNADPHSDSNES